MVKKIRRTVSLQPEFDKVRAFLDQKNYAVALNQIDALRQRFQFGPANAKVLDEFEKTAHSIGMADSYNLAKDALAAKNRPMAKESLLRLKQFYNKLSFSAPLGIEDLEAQADQLFAPEVYVALDSAETALKRRQFLSAAYSLDAAIISAGSEGRQAPQECDGLRAAANKGLEGLAGQCIEVAQKALSEGRYQTAYVNIKQAEAYFEAAHKPAPATLAGMKAKAYELCKPTEMEAARLMLKWGNKAGAMPHLDAIVSMANEAGMPVPRKVQSMLAEAGQGV